MRGKRDRELFDRMAACLQNFQERGVITESHDDMLDEMEEILEDLQRRNST